MSLNGLLERESFNVYHQYDHGLHNFSIKKGTLLCTSPYQHETLLWSTPLSAFASVRVHPERNQCVEISFKQVNPEENTHTITLRANNMDAAKKWSAALSAKLRGKTTFGAKLTQLSYWEA